MAQPHKFEQIEDHAGAGAVLLSLADSFAGRDGRLYYGERWVEIGSHDS